MTAENWLAYRTYWIMNTLEKMQIAICVTAIVLFLLLISFVISIVQTSKLKKQITELKRTVEKSGGNTKVEDDIPVVEPELVYKK